ALGYGSQVQAVFERELKARDSAPGYQVAIWRVLARSGRTANERQGYINQICQAYLDPTRPDRTNAAEALAKLSYQIPPEDLAEFKSLAQDPSIEGVHCRRWLVAASGAADDIRWLAELLDSNDAATRGITAYAL